MIFVDPFDPGGARRWRAPTVADSTVQSESDAGASQGSSSVSLRRCLLRITQASTVAWVPWTSSNSVPRLVQQLECAIGRLGDPVQIQQAEPTVKRNGWKIVLRENVAEGPKAVALDESRASMMMLVANAAANGSSCSGSRGFDEIFHSV